MSDYINLEDMPGANPDEQMDAALAEKKGIRLPKGATNFTRPVETGFRAGGLFMGHGHSEHHNINNQLCGSMSMMQWNSEEPGAIIDYRSSECVIRNLVLHGKDVASQGIIIQREQDQSGIGVGKLHLHDVYIRNCDTAIQVGKPGQHNCDVSYFENVIGRECKTFFRTENDMSIDHTFNRVKSDAEVMFDLVKGGTIYIRDSTTTSSNETTLLRISGAYGPANNNNRSYVDGFKADNNKGSAFKLLEVMSDTIFRAYFNNINIAYDHYAREDGRLVILRGPSYARLSNVHNLQVGTLEFHKDSRAELPTIHVDHCVLQSLHTGPNGRFRNPMDLFNLSASAGSCNFRATNNVDWYGDPVPDYQGIIHTV